MALESNSATTTYEQGRGSYEEKFQYGTKDDRRDSQGNQENIAQYQPDGDERQSLIQMGFDVEVGNVNLNLPYLELDNRTLQMAFYDFYRSFIGFSQTHASNDPEAAWQTYLQKPYIMNKSQVFIAQAMSNMVSPYFTARNDANELANDEANVIQVLSDIVFDDVNFLEKMMRSVTSVCYMPYVVVHKYYDGKKHKLKLVDMTMFKFANFYESDIQNQRFVIEDELVDFWEMAQLYQNHPNWKFVKPGADIYYDANTQLFLYRQDGMAIRNLVRRRTWYSKALNKQLVQINGVLLCDPNQKLQRLGAKKGRPYPFATIVYENFGRETLGGRTLAQKLWADERLASRLQSMAFDMTKQAVVPSVIAYGANNLTGRIFAPGAVINAGNNDNFKIAPIMPPNSVNLKSAFDMLQYIDGLADESANSDALRSGQAEPGIPARNAVIASQNAEITQLGTFKFNLQKFVRDIGLLSMDDVFQFDLGKDIDPLTNKVEWKASLLLPSKSKGHSVLVRLASNSFPDQQSQTMAEMLLAEEANKKGFKNIYQINPDMYMNIEYDCEASVQDAQNKTKEVQKALAMEYDQYMRSNPVYDIYEGARQVTELYYPEKVDILIHKPQPQVPGQPTPPVLGTPPPGAQQPGSQNPIGKQLVNNATTNFAVPGQ